MTEFVDQETREHLGWDYAWNLFQPLSELGKTYKSRLRPYMPPEADQWREDCEDLERLQDALQDSGWSERLQQAIASLRSIEPLFQQAAAGVVLQAGDLFKWKQWMWNGRVLSGIVEEACLAKRGLSAKASKEATSSLFSRWPDVEWDTVLRVLNPQSEWTPKFSLDDAYDPVLKDLRTRRRYLQNQIDQARKEQQEELRIRYGHMPNREREYIWSRDDQAHIDRARTDTGLTIQGETSWDVIFRVQDRESTISLLKEQEQVTEREADREKALLERLTRHLAGCIDAFRQCEAAWGRLDWLVARRLTAKRLGWSFPVWSEDRWEATNACHPLLTDTLRQKGLPATPITFSLEKGVSVLTGPNMGGKTVALRTAGLLQALAQYGMPVPAEEFWFQPVDRIRFVGGDLQSMENGLSTFGGEILRLVNILQSTGTALLLLDEVGRATNPLEGEALAVGLTRFLQGSCWMVLFATHYAGVAEVAGKEGLLRWRVAGLSDYRIVPAGTAQVKLESLWVAEQLGLPAEILTESRDWLNATGRQAVRKEDSHE